MPTFSNPVALAKLAKTAALNVALAKPVTVSGIALATDAASQTAFNHLVTGLQLYHDQLATDADRAQLLASNVSVVTGPIIDAAGASHDMTVAQVLSLILGYFQAYGAARGANLAALAAVKAAGTLADVEAA